MTPWDDEDEAPPDFEDIGDGFSGMYLESKFFGYCMDCGQAYMEGERIWWLGPGRGAYCEGCRVAEEFGPA
jgi:hypothetical protein